MASEIQRERILGNFKPHPKERGHKQSDAAQRRSGMSDEHLKNIRQLPCCVTGRAGPNDPHHLKQTGAKERGMGITSTDRWAIPISRLAHDEMERAGSRNELKWFSDRGVDALVLAIALWNARGDLEKMRKIVLEHKKAGK
jgi:hypothetical protein